MSRGPVVIIGLLPLWRPQVPIFSCETLDVHAMTTVTWLMMGGLIVQTPLAFALQAPKWPEGVSN